LILVDTNVLLDVVEDDPAWAGWSQRQLDAASLRGPICINPVIYAELSMAFARIEELEAVVADGGLEVEEIPREALFLAGKVFLRYRQRSRAAVKRSVLPDFFIGAHAAVRGLPILTRDVGRYRTYFPTLELITPKR
jgi:predicted nucleic acid-binding protein